MDRPQSLTPERALAVLPIYEVNPEWQRKHDAGELPEGFMGMCGFLTETWPDEVLSREEAEYILWLSEQGTMRWLAGRIIGDGNQIYGDGLIRAAKRVVVEGSSND